MNRRKIKNWIPIALALFCSGIVWAESTSKPVAEPTPTKTQTQEGDTYNFYFQKSPDSNKAQPEKEGAAQPKPAEKTVPYTQSSSKAAADLFAGLIFIPDRSAVGFVVGSDFLPRSFVGIKVGLFYTFGSTNKFNDQSQSSIFDSSETTNKNNIYGGDVAFSLNIVNNDRVKIASLLGGLFLSDKHTTSVHSKNFWGDSDSSSSNSSFKIYPYIGLSGTALFSETFGMNLTVSVPTTTQYTSTSLSLVWRI